MIASFPLVLYDFFVEFADANPMVALTIAAGAVLVIGLLLKRFFRPDGPSDRARLSEQAARFESLTDPASHSEGSKSEAKPVSRDRESTK